MSKKQLKQAHVLRKYNEKLLGREEAAKALGMSERQVSRLSKEMKEEGEKALIHKNTGRKPIHALSDEAKAQILAIRKKGIYECCNISHFQELLEREGIKISYTPLYRLLNEAGIKSPKKHRKTKVHRRRKRKTKAGELLQIDATPYDWFCTGNTYALHGAIDDATGNLTGLYLVENECLQGYFEIIRQTTQIFGVPLTVYSDKHTIFRSPLTDKKAEAGEEANLTQFGRALAELGVEIIHAHSPQAKGRIERVWETLQSRLPVEFRLKGIRTVEEANQFLAEEFIYMFNKRFGCEAYDGSIFVTYNHKESIDNILCIKVWRKTDNAGIFSFKGQKFKIFDEGYPLVPAKASIEVLVNIRDSIRVRYKNRVYGTFLQEEVKTPKTKPKKAAIACRHVKPHLCHGTDEWKKVWHYESYEDTLTFIYSLFFEVAS